VLIRKLFKFEGAHIVRNCSSERCKKSIHGHSYIVEVFFTSNGLDNGQMVLDFGLMKTTIKDIIDAFDHAYSMWNRESVEFKNFMKAESSRWIEMPVSPSAEQYSIMFFAIIDQIIKTTSFNNGEKDIELYSVRVHETATGYAEAFRSDLRWIVSDNFLQEIIFSKAITSEWSDPEMYEKIKASTSDYKKYFINPVVTQQID